MKYKHIWESGLFGCILAYILTRSVCDYFLLVLTYCFSEFELVRKEKDFQSKRLLYCYPVLYCQTFVRRGFALSFA